MATFDFSIKPVEALRNDLDRLTVLRFLLDLPPASNLVNLMNELLAEDSLAFDIQWAYHDFASAVLRTEASFVTGDRWRDFLLQMLLELPNPFSISAAKGRMDDTLKAAMAMDLGILQRLFLLDDAMVRNWCAPSQSGADLSGWASFSSQDFYIVDGDGPLPAMRRMLLASEDWSSLVQSLINLHSQYGAGTPLSHRWMHFDANSLTPIASINLRTDKPANEKLLQAIEAFLADPRSIRPVLIAAPDALEQARRALAARDVRVIILRDPSLYTSLAESLRGVRVRFVVLLPAPAANDPLLDELLGEGLTLAPDNLLPIALSPCEDAALASRFMVVL